MPLSVRLKPIVPYLVVMLGAVGLYSVADQIVYMPIPGQIGPDAWPKIVLVLLIVVCAIEIARRVLMSSPEADAALPTAVEHADVPLPQEEDHPLLVLGVGAATVVYLLLLQTGGFFLCTLVYSACLMWIAGLRRPFPAAGLALAITTFFTFTFMKVVFVALPIGTPPFSVVSLSVMALIGIR